MISAAAAAIIAVLVAAPENVWSSLPPLCVFKNLFDLECLGCGMTRALAAAAHGRLEEAMRLNAGVVVVAPLLLGSTLQRLWLRR